MGNFLANLFGLLSAKKMEVVLVGLENSGKTTLLQALANGNTIQTAPTIGLNVKTVRHGGVQMKCWDLGGQAQYRGEWVRYTKGCNAILFVIDSFDVNSLPTAKIELYRLLEDGELKVTPLLIILNKIDLHPHVTEVEVIKELNLDYISENPWAIIPCSALKTININQIVQWLVKQAQ